MILIYRNIFLCIGFLLQAMDSVSVARRIVAAAELAAKEYAAGVPPGGGRVTAPEEVKEARLFLDQARLDVHALPAAVRGYADSALVELRALLERTAPPAELDQIANALGDRLAEAVGGAVVPIPASAPSLARGREVYRGQCAVCHGDMGRGDGPGAAQLKPLPVNLADPQIMGAVSRLDVYRRVLLGVAGTAMPAFERALSEDDRWAVAAYVLTLQYGGSPDAAVFAAVRRQLDSAVSLRSDKIGFDAYLTFEQVETRVRAMNAALAARLEDEFGRLRQQAAAGADGRALQTIQRELLTDLEHAERLVTDQGSRANLLVSSFLLLVREGFEAILIIAALMTFLTRAGAPERRRDVARGAGVAVLASIVTAVLFELLVDTGTGQREAFEGFTMLAATVVLFYVSYWLLSKIGADKWNTFLKSKMQAALSSGSAFALASVAFLAVYREGMETILFYKALLASGGVGGAGAVVGGIVIGSVVLIGLYIAILRLGLRLPMKPFFAVTGALLYYMAFVFAGKGIAELQEGRIVGTTVVPALQWLRVPVLGIYPTVQSLSLQGVLVICAIVAAFLTLRPKRVIATSSTSPAR
jgi:high-affinity iron transporter